MESHRSAQELYIQIAGFRPVGKSLHFFYPGNIEAIKVMVLRDNMNTGNTPI